MKRVSIVLTVFTVSLLLILTIVSAGAYPAEESAVSAVHLHVNIGHNSIYFNSEPSKPVTVTVSDSSDSIKATISAETNEDGQFRSWEEEWQPEQPDIVPGDKVKAEVNGSMGIIDPVGNIEGKVDLDADKMMGTVNAKWLAPTVEVICYVGNQDPEINEEIKVSGVNPDGGSFECDFTSKGVDLVPAYYFQISYLEPDGARVQNQPVSPRMRVQYGEDWVAGDYEAGHKFDITLKDKDGKTKATAKIESTPEGGWGNAGFQTNRDDWMPRDFDIVPTDVVEFAADDGYKHEVQVGEVNGKIDYDVNGVSGTLMAPWFSGDLDVECHPWGAPEPHPGNQHSKAAADGSSKYECNWDPAKWDMKVGQRIAVGYHEPDDGDFVMNIIVDPAPSMRVDKWVTGGSDEVALYGPAVFTIRYHNHGDAPADTVFFTDTLPANTTYLADSSGVTPTISDDKVVWELGPVDEGTEQEFYLVLEHTADKGDTLTNEVDVYNEFDSNDHDDHSEAEVVVSEGQPDVWVDKHRSSHDPTPGGTYLYEINYGNNGPVPAGPVTMTDTLPADTEVVDWYSDNGYDLWEGEVEDGKLILETAAIPANWGDRIRLRLRVKPEVELETELINEVEIATYGDSDLDNNQSIHDGTHVSDPVADLRGQKEHRYGTLVPGGTVKYRIEINNDGNVPVMAKLVDTLPEGTTYLSTDDYDEPVVENGTLTWDMGEMLTGDREDIHFNLAISDTVKPGTMLKNCVEAVMVDKDDERSTDNGQCVEDRVNEPGPNLLVSKRGWWEGDDRIHYNVQVANTGTERLEEVIVTDTYPEGTTFTDNWWGGWDEITMEHDPAKRQIKWTIPHLDRENQQWMDFIVELESNKVGEQGLTFVNLLEAPVKDDVYPDDNTFELKTYSGADLFIHKWDVEENPRAGEQATFTVEFGNGTHSGWDSNEVKIKDTLPEGLKFISATDPRDPNESWDPTVSGNVYTWDWGHLWSDAQLTFDIVVEVEDDVKFGTVLTNEIEIYSDDTDTKDPVPENNKDTADLEVWNSTIYMPVVIKK